ncbi:probable glycosyltransferase 6 [Brachypodium distachyon]|uniref:Glycosyltransferase 6 n=1 Tax=Brachypodium distachyon TaxID=15368 RepID=A0A2K2CN81_BRADI|nr:probable glycosyltransferase 6 [Brachypodium distachyon]PNT63497.1 hypothetical protein BRADI_4g16670v3 [Brachypodium distachyon]|eukprot:XP_003575986.3 probable glycosyltransferase 6 [Brachypodium distachyon]
MRAALQGSSMPGEKGMASESAPFCLSGTGGGKGAAAARAALAGRFHDALVFAAGAAAAVLVLLCTASFLSPSPVPSIVSFPAFPSVPSSSPLAGAGGDDDDGVLAADRRRTFYDDPELSYAVGGGRRLTGWDAKRAEWLRIHGLNNGGGQERVVMLSGSQSHPCKGAGGDHALLRFLKNKVDYCRLHGIQLLYNTALLHPEMLAYWAKIPVVRATMLAHPEAEWVWWVDADAVFTDMDFSLPLPKYKNHNLVFYGWDREVYGEKSWVGLNAGVFLIRNCQWSLDFMDAWAAMSPTSPDYDEWGKILMDNLKWKSSNDSDDQSALVYLLMKNRRKWGRKTYLDHDYFFQGYWAEIVDRLDGVAVRYLAAERRAARPGTSALLRRRHAEAEHALYAAARNAVVGRAVPGPAGGGQTGWRRPFITHFAGCQPCGGTPNVIFPNGSCAEGVRRALNFADDQVLRAYGFRHAGPLSDVVQPLPFGYPRSPARA